MSARLLCVNSYRLLPVIQAFNGRECSRMLEILAKNRHRDDKILSAAARRVSEIYESMTPRECVRSIYGLGKFYYREDQGKTLGVLSAHVRRNREEYSLDQLSQVLSSLARVGLPNAPLLCAVVSSISPESLKTCSSQSLVNLMVAFARLGLRRKTAVWQILADDLVTRGSLICDSDTVSALLAYSMAHPGSPHLALFESVSSRLDTAGVPILAKYLKACARAQYRDLAALEHCASRIREEETKLDEVFLREIVTNFDLLGIDFSTQQKIKSFWFPKRIVSQKSVPESPKPLRRRKWTW